MAEPLSWRYRLSQRLLERLVGPLARAYPLPPGGAPRSFRLRRLLARLFSDLTALLGWLKTCRRFRDHVRDGMELPYADDSPASPAELAAMEVSERFNCDPPRLPAIAGNDGEVRSVLFLNNISYNTYYLTEALRQRGWRAQVVSLEPPHAAINSLYHGEDINIYHPDPAVRRRRGEVMLEKVLREFRMVVISGHGRFSFFRENYNTNPEPGWAPWDVRTLRDHGVKIGWIPISCHEWVTPEELTVWNTPHNAWSLCNHCAFRHDADYPCSREHNLRWQQLLMSQCDFMSGEGIPPIGLFKNNPKAIREPLFTALDPALWSDTLPVPLHFRLPPRQPGEVVIFHLFSNRFRRRLAGQEQATDCKGSWAVEQAVARLRDEGHTIRLLFCDSLHSTQVRYLQMQADIVVEQLLSGVIGAGIRESLMLGRPTVGYFNPHVDTPAEALEYMRGMPMINATPDTVYDRLRELLALSPGERAEIGRRSREFAQYWHNADNCARRFEPIYDRIVRGLPPV